MIRPRCRPDRNQAGIWTSNLLSEKGDDRDPGIEELNTVLPTQRPTNWQPDFANEIPEHLRLAALSSVEFACFMCGATQGVRNPYNLLDPIRLRVSYIIDKQKGGSDELSNLRALCSICNEGAQNISPKRPEWVDLLVQIRRAPALDQVQALKWLMRKFPAQARDILQDCGAKPS